MPVSQAQSVKVGLRIRIRAKPEEIAETDDPRFIEVSHGASAGLIMRQHRICAWDEGDRSQDTAGARLAAGGPHCLYLRRKDLGKGSGQFVLPSGPSAQRDEQRDTKRRRERGSEYTWLAWTAKRQLAWMSRPGASGI